MFTDALCEEQNCDERVIVEEEVEVDTGNCIAESVIFCSLNVVMLCPECVCLCACVVSTLYILVTIDYVTVMYIALYIAVSHQMLVAGCCKYFTTRKNWSREFITEYLSP